MSSVMGRANYSIAAVSKLTGVSCHALRVWERRYGFPVPDRSASGHRRYESGQVTVLTQLARLARTGHTIGELIGEYQAGTLEISGGATAKVGERSPASQLVDRLFEGDMALADTLLDRLSERLPALDLMEKLIEPALVEVGERWFRGECEIYQERCAVASLFGRISRLVEKARRANVNPTRTVLLGTVRGDRHEGGVMMVSLALELAGWRAVPLGVDIPTEEFQKAIEDWKPDALGISFVLSRNINKRFVELSKIHDVPVFVGGRSIVNHQGLARRHGLIPLTGSLRASVTQLAGELETWRNRNKRGVDRG